MCRAPRGQLHLHRHMEGVSASALTHEPCLHFWIKKHMLPTWYLKASFLSILPPPFTASYKLARRFRAAPASRVDIEKQMEMKSLWFRVAVTPKTTSGMMEIKVGPLVVIACQLNLHSVKQGVNKEEKVVKQKHTNTPGLPLYQHKTNKNHP